MYHQTWKLSQKLLFSIHSIHHHWSLLMFLRFLAVTLLAALLNTLTINAQPHRHLEQTHILNEYESLESWLGRASWLRDHIQISTGLWPMPERGPLNPHYSDVFEEEGYRVRTVVLEPLPGFYLTGTLFYPPGDGPHPAVLSAHGHWSEGRFEHNDSASIPGRALTLAQQGYVVLSYSMIGYNETKDLFPHRFDEPHYQLWGFSAMGLQLWNSLRALDLLASLPEVDPSKIGMTGASGGGTQTFLLTAIDERIRVSAPVNMISSHFQGGCICENAPLLRQNLNNVEIGALAAPRPLMLVSTSGDWTVNTPDNEYPAIQQIYRLFGTPERVMNAHFDYPHNYNKDSREAVYDWFGTWLLESGVTPKEASFTLPESAQREARLPSVPATPDDVFASFKAMAQQQLALDPSDGYQSIEEYRNTLGTAMGHVFPHTQFPKRDLTLRTPSPRSEASGGVLIVHDGTEAGHNVADQEARLHLDAGKVVALLPLSSNRITPPDSISYWTTYNPTPAQQSVLAIIHAAHFLYEQPDINHVDLIGLGTAGPLTMLARSQASFVSETTVDFNHTGFDSDEQFLEEAYIPLLRRAGDFKTASVLIAPAHLEIKNLPEGPLRDWIRSLYKELGASAMLSLE